MTEPLLKMGSAIPVHLLSSTVFAIVMWLLALLLRNDRAHIRYWLWLTASLKFFVPFTWFVTIGSHLLIWTRSLSPAHIPSYARVYDAGIVVADKMQSVPSTLHWVRAAQIRVPGHPILLLWLWGAGTLLVLAFRCMRWRALNNIRLQAIRTVAGRESLIWRRVHPSQDIPLCTTDAHVEPSLFGVFESALIWPKALTESLDDEQIEAIMRHELWHAFRRDNLTMWIQLIVEAAFWFHPAVWWIEKHLLIERERACDEGVLDQGINADVYARSILQTCHFYLEEQSPSASSISGADLRDRIRSIVAYRPSEQSLAGKLRIIVIATVIVWAPVAYGFIWKTPFYGQILLPNGPLPSFEVATIKLSKSDTPGVKTRIYQGAFTAEHASLTNLLKFAYRFKADDELVGRPKWSDTQFFDVSGKVDEETAAKVAKLPIDQMIQETRLRVQSLLAERFHLSVTTRNENRKAFALVIAKGGPKIMEVESAASVESSAPKNGEAPPPPAPGGTRGQQNPLDSSERGKLVGKGASMAMFTQWLSTQPELGDRTVVNQTGLGGKYDFSLTGITSPVRGSASPTDDPGTSVFTLIREQLGLETKYKDVPLEVLVIEKAERPSPN